MDTQGKRYKYKNKNSFIKVKFRLLTEDDIYHQLINLSQLVFEVTDDCNLRCYYCAYGELYCDYDERQEKYMKLEEVKPLLDYLLSIWEKEPTDAYIPETTLGFYGGEPLLNVPFIKDVIEYFKSANPKRKFNYSMTTNAVLLDKYMSFLANNDFRLLISIDGDEDGDSYRVNLAGEYSFNQVFRNINLLKDTFPDYYNRRVSFSSVIHNRNSVEATIKFISKYFDKIPIVANLSEVGIKPELKAEFDSIFKDVGKSYNAANDYNTLLQIAPYRNPEVLSAIHVSTIEGGNTYSDIIELFNDKDDIEWVPTGTCVPFSRKLYVTVNGKILPCEKISHKYALANVSNKSLSFDCRKIAQQHNGYLKQLLNNCRQCGRTRRCLQCVYQIPEYNVNNPKCPSLCTSEQFESYNSRCLAFFKKHPEYYGKILEEVEHING